MNTKATAVKTVLSRLMSNVGGPKQYRRALLASVVTPVITYGIAIWAMPYVLFLGKKKKKNTHTQIHTDIF